MQHTAALILLALQRATPTCSKQHLMAVFEESPTTSVECFPDFVIWRWFTWPMFRDRYTINGKLSETRELWETLWENRSYAHAPMLRHRATEMGREILLCQTWDPFDLFCWECVN